MRKLTNDEIRMTNDRNIRRRAFTLVEVMVSLAIIAVLLPPILSALSLESHMAAAARNRTQAAALGRQKLGDLVANYPLTNGLQQSSGDFSDQGPEVARFTWSATDHQINSDTVDNNITTLHQIDFTITWKESSQDRTLVLSTLIYVNTASTGGL